MLKELWFAIVARNADVSWRSVGARPYYANFDINILQLALLKAVNVDIYVREEICNWSFKIVRPNNDNKTAFMNIIIWSITLN